MTFVLVKDGAVVKYPYTIAQLKLDNPKVSFPIEFTDEGLASWGLYEVVGVDTPPQVKDQVVEALDPVFSNGRWVAQWLVRDKTDTEVAADEAQVQIVLDHFFSTTEVRSAFVHHNMLMELRGEPVKTRAEFKEWWDVTIS